MSSLRSGLLKLILGLIAVENGGLLLHAERFDYFSEDLFAQTTVNITTLLDRPTAIAEIFKLVEQQTPFEFIYLSNKIPANAHIVIESAPTITLARLFSSISTLAGVVFSRQQLKIVVRLRNKDDTIAFTPRGLSDSPVSFSKSVRNEPMMHRHGRLRTLMVPDPQRKVPGPGCLFWQVTSNAMAFRRFQNES